jgi:hypothetical protein
MNDEEKKFLIPKPSAFNYYTIKQLFTDEKKVYGGGMLHDDSKDIKRDDKEWSKYIKRDDKDWYDIKDEKKWKQEEEDKKFNIWEHLPSKVHVPPVIKQIIPANYDALEVHGYYGLIHMGKGAYNEDNVIVHTSKKHDRRYMLAIQPGDYIPVVFLRGKRKGYVFVRYITRSKYFAPGTPVTSIDIGVENWNNEDGM